MSLLKLLVVAVVCWSAAAHQTLQDELLAAELEVVRSSDYRYRPIKPFITASHPWPWAPTFYQSLPANLTTEAMTTAATPVFAVVGDAMGALGFQMCDIEHYLDHENHTLAPCPGRAGWATKVAADYGDKIWLVHHMIRSTNNAARVSVPLLFNQFNNNTQQLKLVVVAIGSKYASAVRFREPLVTLTQSMVARGIKVVLMTRPPINTSPTAPLWFNNYNTTTAAAINQAIREASAETGAACLDTWELFLGLGDRWKEALGPDGVHYSPLGQQLVHQGLMEVIAKHYPELSPSQLFKA